MALRAAAAHSLPPELSGRKKRGFPVPLAGWLRQDTYYTMVREKFVGPVAEQFFDTRALCELLEAHRQGKVNAMTKIWSFYCFILWYELYFVDPQAPQL